MERRLTDEERDALVAQPLTAVFATERKGGGVHAVPVWYLYCDGELRIVTDRDSLKARNATRTGRATLCVTQTIGMDLRYVTAEGTIRIEDCTSEFRRDLWTHYTTPELAAEIAAADASPMCVMVLTPDRWTAIVE